MPVPLFVVPLLLLSAVLVRRLGTSRRQLGPVLAALTAVGTICLLVVDISRLSTLTADSIWLIDDVSRSVIGFIAVALLILSLLEDSPILLAGVLWSAGLLAAVSLTRLPVLLWVSVQFSILPLLFYGRSEEKSVRALFWRHSTPLVGSLLFGIGLVCLFNFDPIAPGSTAGLILVLCGLGAMLGWFPFPQAVSDSPLDESPGAIIGKRCLPLLTAAVMLLRVVEQHPLSSYQMLLVALVALFSLFLCGARLQLEERLSRRMIFAGLSLLSFLCLAVCLQNWEEFHPYRDWVKISNLPAGRQLFVSILLCEMAGLLAFACGSRQVNSMVEGSDFTQTLAGAAGRRPLSSLTLIFGLLSLAGLPPFPGFWWRFELIAALRLPHRQSELTQLAEADHSFALLAFLLAVVMIVNSLGHLKLLQLMLFEEPFRVRREVSPLRVQWGTGIALALLLSISFVPLSVPRLMERGPNASRPKSAPIKNSSETQRDRTSRTSRTAASRRQTSRHS